MRAISFAVLLVWLLVPLADLGAQTLEGAIDLHAHAAPDGTPRKLDAIELARMAKAAGMRAIVIKNHYEPTASVAFVVRKAVPGIEVFGGISLDLTVGGVNAAAVDWMTKVEGGYGKVVWLPTFDSESQVKLTGDERPFAPVTRGGKILPEVLAVIDIAAKHDLVLEMGHSAPEESLLIIPEARRRGVKHVVVTHAMQSPGGSMTLEQMREAARQGALLELVYSPLTEERLAKEAEAIKAIGAASFVISSDLGQPPNPVHTEGLLAIYEGLMAHGVSAADIDVMARKNPARLLGLEPAAAQLSAPAAPRTLIPVDNGNPALITDRHLAAQSAGYRALHYCSAIFSARLPDALIEQSLGRRAARDARTVIDRENKIVSVHYASDMEPRIAAWRPGLGCTQLPIGATAAMIAHLPRMPDSISAPSLDDRQWPLGDADATAPLSRLKSAAVGAVLDEAFKDDAGIYRGRTWGVVVVKDGRIVAERYKPGWDVHTAARTNSMCKSIGVSLVGIGVRAGLVDLHRRAPLEAWQTPGDPRGDITLNDLLHMASGLYTEAGGDPLLDTYDAGAPPSEISMLNMVDSRPGARFVYAGSDTIMAGRAVREALNDDATWLVFPYRELLWKLGMTRTVIETDWRGDFLVSGQCWSTARDFGRFGMLYLADGVWNGERVLPEGWSTYVSTLAPAQPASYLEGGPGYGAQFWIHGGREGLPEIAYAANGAGGQYAMIVPSANLVIVRRGFDVDSDFNVAKFSADVLQALER